MSTPLVKLPCVLNSLVLLCCVCQVACGLGAVEGSTCEEASDHTPPLSPLTSEQVEVEAFYIDEEGQIPQVNHCLATACQPGLYGNHIRVECADRVKLHTSHST